MKRVVLNVDDHAAGRYATSKILASAGFDVLEAASGSEALALVRERKPDLILLDVNLPDISGLEVCRRIKADGETRHIPVLHISATSIHSDARADGLDGGADGYLTTPIEPRELVSAVNALLRLKESEELFRDLVEHSSDLICTHDLAGKILSVNEAAARLSGYSREALVGMNVADLIDPAVREQFGAHLAEIGTTGRAQGLLRVRTATGDLRYWEFTNSLRRHRVAAPIVRAWARDVTERVVAERERDRMEAALRQAQKMEAVGLLAGGVAHDFNNMITVIRGYAELALLRLAPSDPLHAELTEILTAATRSAELTKQLLAFSRTQVVAPIVMQLNHVIADELKMLTRLVPENIQVVPHLAPALWEVRMDPAQVTQLLVNVATNARDAIVGEGTITIDTSNVTFDAPYVDAECHIPPGEYVQLAISDSGVGMDAATRVRIFEPFFTTKAVGKGTGLGLATVYGIVKQNNGFVTVESELGKGTTLRFYFPRAHDDATSSVEAPRRDAVAGGTETVLVVEDNASLKRLTSRALESQGYQVLAAESPTEALELADRHPGPIHLLLTDVVMPVMNGRELSHRLLATRPDVRVLFMSGYPADVISRGGIVAPGIALLQKPFTAQSLAAKVREVLDA